MTTGSEKPTNINGVYKYEYKNVSFKNPYSEHKTKK